MNLLTTPAQMHTDDTTKTTKAARNNQSAVSASPWAMTERTMNTMYPQQGGSQP